MIDLMWLRNNGQSKRLVKKLRGELTLEDNRDEVAEGVVNKASVSEKKLCRNRALSFLSGMEMRSVNASSLSVSKNIS